MQNLRFVELVNWRDDIPVTDSVWVGTTSLPEPDLSKFYLCNDILAARLHLSSLGYSEIKMFEFIIGSGL